MTEFLVVCPRCARQAVVKKERLVDFYDYRLDCYTCHHSERMCNNIVYNVIVKRNCDNCGKAIDVTFPNSKAKVEALKFACPSCHAVRVYKPRNESFRIIYKSNGALSDPFFNLPLWFQDNIKGYVFWAYNREHLNEISNYVGAKLRERQTMTHTTMVERLPTFITAAKNRKTVLKAISKLLEK